jgi:hypothetical protein
MSPITRTATHAAVVLLLAAVAPARAERDPDDRCAHTPSAIRTP